MDGILSGRSSLGELIVNNDPVLSWNGVDVQCKLRPNEAPADIASLGLDY